MLLTKETATHERFDEVKSHALLVENILLFKKSCGNVIKVCFGVRLIYTCANNLLFLLCLILFRIATGQFSKQNIPHSCIQVKNNELPECNLFYEKRRYPWLLLGFNNSPLRIWVPHAYVSCAHGKWERWKHRSIDSAVSICSSPGSQYRLNNWKVSYHRSFRLINWTFISVFRFLECCWLWPNGCKSLRFRPKWYRFKIFAQKSRTGENNYIT